MAESRYTGKEISPDNIFVSNTGVSSAVKNIFYDQSETYEQKAEKSVESGIQESLSSIENDNWDTEDSLQAARMFTDGLWLNKGEEVGAWLGAAAYKLFGMYGSEGKSIGEIKEEMLARSEADSATFRSERPVAATVSNLAGNLLSPVSLKGGQLLQQARTLRQGELARQSAVATQAATRPIVGGSGVGMSQAQAQASSQLAQQLSGFSPRAYQIATQTRTPVLAAGATAAESAVIGFEGENIQDKLTSAAQSAVLGGTFSFGLSGTGFLVNKAIQSNVAQELGKKSDFVGLMFTEHALSPVYKHVVSKAFGGKSLIEQQIRGLKARLPSLDDLKNRKVDLANEAQSAIARAKVIATGTKEKSIEQAKQLKENLKLNLTANKRIKESELDEISAARIADLESGTTSQALLKTLAIKEADAAVNAMESSFRSSAFKTSMPSLASKTDIDEVQSLAPQEALDYLRQVWQKVGFSAAHNKQYLLDLDETSAAVEALIEKSPSALALSGSNGAGVTKLISNYVKEFISENSDNGLLTGKNLTQLRSDIGSVINDISENKFGSIKIANSVQEYFDNILLSKLSKSERDSFLKDKELWRTKSTLEDAVGNATGSNKIEQGAFTADNWIAANKTQNKYLAKVGKGALQKEAQQLSNLSRERKALIEANALENANEISKETRKIVNAEKVRLSNAKKDLAKEFDQNKINIDREYRQSAKTAADKARKKVALEQESQRFKMLKSNIDNNIASLSQSIKFIDNAIPSDPSTFERLFATSLIASSLPIGALIDTTLGLGVALAGTIGGRGLAAESTQRFLAGQTSAQKSASVIAENLDSAAQKLADRYGLSYRPAVSGVAAIPQQKTVVFDEKSKTLIRKQQDKNKASIYQGLLRSGKAQDLQAQDPEFHDMLKTAYDKYN